MMYQVTYDETQHAKTACPFSKTALPIFEKSSPPPTSNILPELQSSTVGTQRDFS
jgi:hypothetical protein